MIATHGEQFKTLAALLERIGAALEAQTAMYHRNLDILDTQLVQNTERDAQSDARYESALARDAERYEAQVNRETRRDLRAALDAAKFDAAITESVENGTLNLHVEMTGRGEQR